MFKSSDQKKKELLERYAPRRPMLRLDEQFYKTDANANPALLHFGLPVDSHNLALVAEDFDFYMVSPDGTYSLIQVIPDHITQPMAEQIVHHLAKELRYPITLCWPFEPTSDSDIVVGFYDNYTVDPATEPEPVDVIEALKVQFGLDSTVRPKWYFDVNHRWKPADEDADEEYEDEDEYDPAEHEYDEDE